MMVLRAGLINQQYSHIAAFALAAVLGAEIVLPPAAKRDSFAHYFSVFKEQVSGRAASLLYRGTGGRRVKNELHILHVCMGYLEREFV